MDADRAARLRRLEAIVELARPRPDRARALALLREQVVVSPTDERPWIGIVDLTAGEPDALLSLARLAHSASGLNEVAWYFALRHQPQVGLSFARRSLAADTGCWACEDTLAMLLFQSGRCPEALAAQRRSVQLRGDAPVPSDVKERLQTYREACGNAAE